VRIRGIQLDLVVNRIVFTCNWLKLYKYKIRLELGNGTENPTNTGNRRSSGLGPFVLVRWDGRTDVLVLVLALAFEGASSGSAGLVAFWLFCVVA
jgi:hypothetical protein